ncbi:MAG: response regulator [Candidatus Altiarchaeota archaeon]
MATILIVEDHPEMQKLYYNMLSYDYSILQAYNVREAEEALEKHDVDLIILDMVLPEQDGHTFLLDIRKNEKYRRTPVIVSTVLSRKNQSVRMSEKIGRAIYFKKPFHPFEFKTAVDSHLQQSTNKKENLLKYINSD